MYKLLIVDDEKEIRDGLSEIHWDSLGILLVGCCKHGLEALQVIFENPPDIVLTDIRMPFMNGIELMESLKVQYPFMKVMILSGYSDFEYVKKALQSGAVDYLLKPTDFNELVASFNKMVRRLDAEKQEEYRKAVLESKERLLTKRFREDFLERLIHSVMSFDDIEQGASEGEILLDSGTYSVSILRLDRISLYEQPLSDHELKQICFALDNVFADKWTSRGKGYFLIDPKNAQSYILSTKLESKADLVDMKQQLEHIMGLLKSTVTIVMGKPVTNVIDIKVSADTATALLEKTREEDQLVEYQEGFTQIFLSQAENAMISPSVASDISIKSDGIVLQQAKKYIWQNYQSSITLKEVANQVFVTPGHLSVLFRQSGETFLQFLTSLRIQKAAQLLSDVHYKIYEVGEMVGYSDPAYFSEVFKKHMGKTPIEFRSH
jgi:two-component system response regulator YesN